MIVVLISMSLVCAAILALLIKTDYKAGKYKDFEHPEI